MIKAFDDNGAITFKTYIWLEGRVTPKNIIKTYKAFVWVTEEALASKVAEKVLQ